MDSTHTSVRLYSSRVAERVVDVNIVVHDSTYSFQVAFQNQPKALYDFEFNKRSIKDILGFIRELVNSLSSRHFSIPQNFCYVRKNEKGST